MKLSQFIALADADREGLLFDLKAKALIAGKKDIHAELEKLNGEGDSIELLGELQTLGVLPEIQPDADDAADSRLVFPIEAVFPPWVVQMVEQTASAAQVDAGHAAQDFRLALNALIGTSLRYEITPDWTRHCGLFLCIVGESGSGKSRTSRHFMAPVYELQKKITEAEQAGRIATLVEIEALEAERTEKKRQLEATHKPRKKTELSSAADADTLKKRLAEIDAELPLLRKGIAPVTIWETDVTTEYLLKVMTENGGQVAIVGVETPLFGVLVGRYTQGVIESVEVFNDAYDGMPVSAGRMKNKAKVVCEEPRLAVSVGTQPTVLYKTHNSSTLLERGTLARFSFFEPTSRIGKRDMRIASINADVKQKYLSEMLELAYTFRARPPNEGDLCCPHEPNVLRFSDPARLRFERWRQLREAERISGGRLSKMLGFQARIDDILPRTAAQLHVLWHGTRAADIFITEETIERAILVTEFDIQATERVFEKMGLDSLARLADAIEDWAEENDFPDTTVQKLSRASLGMEKTADQVRAACAVLQQDGFLTVQKTTKKQGGRPSERVIFNAGL